MQRSLTAFLLACSSAVGIAQAGEIIGGYSFDNATVLASGPRAGANGKSYFNIEGPGQGQFRSFGVLDYRNNGYADSFARSFSGNVGDITAMSIDLTEGYPPSSWYTTGTLMFYVVTDTTTSIQPGSPIVCQLDADQCGTQLGTKYLLGSGLYDVNWGNGAERHTLDLTTIDPTGKQIIISALNSGATFRIVVEGVANVGAGLEGQFTFNGVYLAPYLRMEVTEESVVIGPDCFTKSAPAQNGFPVAGGANGVSDSSECVGDWDRNGTVEPADIAQYIQSWSYAIANPGPSIALQADVDCNGLIEPSDIAVFIQNWVGGTTPGGLGCP
ncbi:MAG: hypothetical protein KF745_07865 [Phycisphaeraceae bacterium]|nr:hypothetical protein [Phycisphaeraceae bacterium]